MSNFETINRLPYFFICHWEPDFKNLSEPDLWKIEVPDFHVKILKWEPIFCVSKHWEPDFKFSKEPDLLKIEDT